MSFTSWVLFALILTLCGNKPLTISNPINEVEKLEATNKNCNPVNTRTVFKDGEVLNYKVYYNWTALWAKAGEVSFKVKEEAYKNQPVFHAIAIGQTYPSYDWIFKVRDKYETFMAKPNLAPVKFERDIKEGSFEFKRSYEFNRSLNTAKSTYTRENHSRAKTIENVPSCTYDLLSSIYYARTVDVSSYEPGDTIPFSVIIDNDIFKLYIRYEGREEKKTKLGKFNCLKIKPLLVEGSVFKQGEHMTVWVTDDDNRIPVRIEAKILVGSIKADLSSYAGLKHPFNAIINK